MASNDRDNSLSSYIYGAGDDEDNWAHDLRPDLFWQHQTEILETARYHPDQLSELVSSIILSDQRKDRSMVPVAINSTHLMIGSTSMHANIKVLERLDPFDAIIACCNEAEIANQQARLQAISSTPKLLQLHCKPGKLCSS